MADTFESMTDAEAVTEFCEFFGRVMDRANGTGAFAFDWSTSAEGSVKCEAGGEGWVTVTFKIGDETRVFNFDSACDLGIEKVNRKLGPILEK